MAVSGIPKIPAASPAVSNAVFVASVFCEKAGALSLALLPCCWPALRLLGATQRSVAGQLICGVRRRVRSQSQSASVYAIC